MPARVEYTFEWDPEKAGENQRKHGVPFELAAGIFEDPLALSIYDDMHSSTDDDRWITLGRVGNQLLVVIHTFREVDPDEAVIRIISARTATAAERRQYESEP